MHRAPWLAIVLFGCAASPGPSSAALSADRWSDDAPAWLADAEPIDAVGALSILALEAPRGPEQSDARPARPLVAARDGRYLLPPAPALAARIVADRIAWVTVAGELILDDGEHTRTLDHDAIPELDVASDGRTLAWARRPGPEAGVRVLDAADVAGESTGVLARAGTARERARHADGRARSERADSGTAPEPRLVTPGLQIADRPRFVDARTLLVVGSRPSGIAGVWAVRWSDRDPRPRALTNGALRAGEPLGESFVPPPADHASMRVEDDVLVYHDGAASQRIELGLDGEGSR